MGTENPRIKIAILGGGIAGLALAAGLHKKHKHIDFHIYEAVPDYKNVGAGLALHKNAIKAMTLIGDEVRKAYFDNASDMGEEDRMMSTEVILAHGPNKGELVAELGKAKGRKSISRADLLDGLLKLIPEECISFSKRVQSIEDLGDEGVSISFEDGTEARADGLIGADGIHSMVRRHILGPDHPATEPKNHDGWKHYRTTVSMELAREYINERWTSVVPILLGPRGYFNCIPLNKGTRINVGVAVKAPNPTENGVAPELDTAWYDDYTEDAKQIARLVVEHPGDSWIAADHDHAPKYFEGRIAMMGDAAHAAMPFSGQGAAQALEDAAVLDRLFRHLTSPNDIRPVFSAYDAVRRPRSQKVVDMSRKFGRIYAYAEGDMHEHPEQMKEYFANSTAFTNDADLDEHVKTACWLFRRRVHKLPELRAAGKFV